MENTERQYYCFQCGKPMTNLPTLPIDKLYPLTDKFGCKECNFVQEKDHTVRRISPTDYTLRYDRYEEELKKLETIEE